MDESKEAGSEFIEAGGDPSELLELEEEGFHEMTLLVKPPIDVPRIGIIFPWRDTEIRLVVGDKFTELPLAVGAVGENLHIEYRTRFYSQPSRWSIHLVAAYIIISFFVLMATLGRKDWMERQDQFFPISPTAIRSA